MVYYHLIDLVGLDMRRTVPLASAMTSATTMGPSPNAAPENITSRGISLSALPGA